MTSEIISSFDSAVGNLGFRPKGVKVGQELYRQLKEYGRVEKKRALLGGVLDMGMELPFLDGDIHVHIGPELDDWDYEMPQCA